MQFTPVHNENPTETKQDFLKPLVFEAYTTKKTTYNLNLRRDFEGERTTELCSLMLNMMVSDFAIVSGLEYIYLTFITTKSFLCGGSLENLPMSRGRTGFAAIIPIQMVSPSQE